MVIHEVSKRLDKIVALQPEIIRFAAEMLFESYQECLDDAADSDGSMQSFIERFKLLAVSISRSEDHQLVYSTHGTPLVIVTLSPELAFKQALFD